MVFGSRLSCRKGIMMNKLVEMIVKSVEERLAVIDEPQTEGAYLHLEDGKWIAKQVRMMDNVGLFYDERESPSGSVFIHKVTGGLVEPDGKWISLSAIVPTKDGE